MFDGHVDLFKNMSGTDYCGTCDVAELEDAVRRARTEEIRIPFGVGIAGVVAQSKEIINIRDAYQVKLDLLTCINMAYPVYSKTSNINVYQESSWEWVGGGGAG
jgi:hypothetical protein